MYPNAKNIRKAIIMMERVKANEERYGKKLLDMRYFRREKDSETRTSSVGVPSTEEGVLRECGTTCCFAGWVAVAAEFKEEVFCDEAGFPQIIENEGLEAHVVVSHLLGIPENDAVRLIYGWSFYYKDTHHSKTLEEITIDDVIERLNSFLPKE